MHREHKHLFIHQNKITQYQYNIYHKIWGYKTYVMAHNADYQSELIVAIINKFR